MADPFTRLKLILGYAVCAMWVFSFVIFLVLPMHAEAPITAASAALMLVLGSLYAISIRRRNGAGDS